MHSGSSLEHATSMAFIWICLGIKHNVYVRSVDVIHDDKYNVISVSKKIEMRFFK